jgi:putative aldouronate transport system permease protein
MLSIIAVTLLPLLHITSASLSGQTAVLGGSVGLFPKDFNLSAYRLVFSTDSIPRAFRNSVFIMVFGTFFNMALTITMAYALSITTLPFKRFFLVLITITMFFSGGLIPSFLLVRSLGMYNTFAALVVPGGISTWNLIVMRTFFQSSPKELKESAYLEGAGEIAVLVKIVLPLSTAIIATISLYYAVGHWNDWFSSLIYLYDSKKYPLPMMLRELIMENRVWEYLMEARQTELAAIEFGDQKVSPESLKYAVIVISFVPMLVLYPFLQRYFLKGVMVGSLKG